MPKAWLCREFGLPSKLTYEDILPPATCGDNKLILNVLFAIDAVHPNDNYEYLNLGLETNINKMFSIRAGYPGIGKKDAIEGLSLGLGLKYPIMNTSNTLVVEYTSADFGPLGIVQRVSLGFNY